MSTLKDMIAGIAGIETYEEEVKLLQYKLGSLADQVAKLKVRNEELAARNAFLEMEDEDKLEILLEDVAETERLFKQRSEECADLQRLLQEKLKEIDNKIHSAFAEGRRVGYVEMGIRCIDARKEGKQIVAIWSDEDLIDVKEEDADLIRLCDMEEIEISDLVEVTA